MIKLWKHIVGHGESVRSTEELVGKVLSGVKNGKKRKRKRKSTALQRIEDDLISLLGTKVIVKPKSRGGSIEIDYYSDDDLSRLMDIISDKNS
jgi:ParB family chromosome partitioning protein